MMEVDPLTRCNGAGLVYRRTAEVETQILESLTLTNDALIERIGLRFTVDGFFREECLVYLIRKAQSEEQLELVNKLTEALIRRCGKHIDEKVRWALDKCYAKDCFDDVICAAFERILDLRSDRADFAQACFWVWLDGIISGELRRYRKRQREDAHCDSLDQEDEDSDERDMEETPEALREQAPSPDLRAMTQEALNVLTPKEQMVFLMRHYWEWEIENQNPDVPTISRYFEVTPRTISNWLRKAEEKLQPWLRSKR